MTARPSNTNSPTTASVYELVDRKMGEVNSTVLRLEAKFDALEAGRLTALEREVGQMQIKQAITNTKLATYIAIIVFTVTVAVNVFIQALIK